LFFVGTLSVCLPFAFGRALRACTNLYMYAAAAFTTTGTLPNIRNTLNKNSTRHSGPRIAANSVE